MMEKYNEPRICIVNNDEIAERLSGNYQHINSSNLGIKKVVEYNGENKRFCNLEFSLPENLHEYSVVIIDLQENREGILCRKDEKPRGGFLFEVDYPKEEFNPSPYVMSVMTRLLSKKCLKIVFSGKSYGEEYKIVDVIQQGCYGGSAVECYKILDCLEAYSLSKTGEKIKAEENRLAKYIEKYVVGYKSIFDLPKKWDDTTKTNKVDEKFYPLLENQDGEVVSYFAYSGSLGYELVLPLCEKKSDLIEGLLTTILPEIIPDFFPEAKTFAWSKEQEFLSKEVIEIENRKIEIQKEYEEKLKRLDESREIIQQEYCFFTELLTETGDKLVDAVVKYFKWLGFDNVEKMDGKEVNNREDIQIITDDIVYIIEVKGLGGTSTDSECAQISKHRRRRERENKEKTIVPIYIVNHQRFLKPTLRKNPPFTDDQIDYAKNDERGLLSTWQLYKQYKLIEDGIFSKSETRESLKINGLISLTPKNLIFIGKYDEYFKKSNAGIIKLEKHKITVGEEIYARKDDKWVRARIVSIEIDGVNHEQVDGGEVGVVTDVNLEKGFELFVKDTENAEK